MSLPTVHPTVDVLGTVYTVSTLITEDFLKVFKVTPIKSGLSSSCNKRARGGSNSGIHHGRLGGKLL
jgi:hypothetical protein